jgi:drug/metabolite transporter (DMT)-like permease
MTAMTTSATQRRNAYIAWAAICFIWGTTYLGIKISLETIPPFLIGGLRFATAGLVLAIVRRLQGKSMPNARGLFHAFVAGVLLLGFGNGGVVYGEQFTPSGLAAVLVAAVPFWMVGVEAMLPTGERLTRRSVLGLLIGFAGIVMLVWPDLHFSADHNSNAAWGFAIGVLALQLACFGWALGSSYSRRHRATGDDLITTSAFQMFFGGATMLVLGTVTGEWNHFAVNPRTGSALLYLFTVGSLIGFVAYIYALGHLSTSFVSLYAYVNPVVAVILGTLILDEPFGWRLIAAIGIILGGMAVVTRKGTGGARNPAPSPSPSPSSSAASATS